MFADHLNAADELGYGKAHTFPWRPNLDCYLRYEVQRDAIVMKAHTYDPPIILPYLAILREHLWIPRTFHGFSSMVHNIPRFHIWTYFQKVYRTEAVVVQWWPF